MIRKSRCITLSESDACSVFKTVPFGMTGLAMGSLYVVAKSNRNIIRATVVEKYRLLRVLRQARYLHKPACRQLVLQRFAMAVSERNSNRWSDFFGAHSPKSIAQDISLA